MTPAVTAIALDRPRAVAERAPFVEGLFFMTVFTVTYAKLQWEVAGTLSFSPSSCIARSGSTRGSSARR
jgi:hypothetical protein